MEFIELVARHNPDLANILFRLYQEIQWAKIEFKNHVACQRNSEGAGPGLRPGEGT